MSHYYTWVLAETDKMVSELLKPYDENNNDYQPGGWDWYSIGGRWEIKSNRFTLTEAFNIYPFLPGIYGGEMGTISKYDWTKNTDWVMDDKEWEMAVKEYTMRLSPKTIVSIVDIHS